MKNKFFAFLFLTLANGAMAQTVSSILPPNLKSKVPEVSNYFQTEKVDNEAEKIAAREINETTGDKMMRFGKELSTQIDFISAAEKFVQPNGRTLYQFGIESKGALSINLILDKFYLAEGANLFLTDEKTKRYIGAYTSANNNEAEALGTELLHASKIVVVLDEPAFAANPSRFIISTVVHGFEDLETLAKGLNTSGDCHYDINCSLGAGYELQRNSVAMMVNGGGFCTGSLVNNTSGNIIPYFISARHCGTNPTNWVFRFRWEAPVGQTSCATTSPSGNGPITMNVNGAQLKAQNTNSDFILLKLNANPDPSWGVYYNGWDNTDSLTASAGIGIHHPDGDLKKISIDTDPLSQQTITFIGTQDHAWNVNNWEYGATEPGSSGSPLFNQEKRLIGVLSGGTSACQGTNTNGLSDFYGRFGYGWDTDPSASGQLKHWLDSVGTGATIIDGVDPLIGNDPVDASLTTLLGIPESKCDSVANFSFKLLNSGLNTLTQVDVAYGFNGVFSNTYTWNGSLPTYGTSTVYLNGITIPLGQNTFTIKVINSNGLLDGDLSNNLLSVPILRLQNDFTAKLRLELDCYASETSWDIKNMLGNVIYTSETYYDDTPDTLLLDFCLSFGCYTFSIYDQYGDGMSGCSAGVGGNGNFVLSNASTGAIYAQLTDNQANFGNIYEKQFGFGCTAGLGDILFEEQIQLFPNPGSENLTIHVGSQHLESISIYSYTGQVIMSDKFESNITQINTSNWPSSIYLVNIKTDKGEVMKRWIKK